MLLNFSESEQQESLNKKETVAESEQHVTPFISGVQ